MPGRIVIASAPASAARIAQILQAEYFDVSTADKLGDGGDALAREINLHKADCLIIAPVFDGQSGYDICAQLKQRGEFAHLPCIVCGDGELDWRRVAECGVDDAFVLESGDAMLPMVERLRELYRRKEQLDSLLFHLTVNSELGFDEPRSLPFNAARQRLVFCLICDDAGLEAASRAALLAYPLRDGAEVVFVERAKAARADLCLIACAKPPTDTHFTAISDLTRADKTKDTPILCYQVGGEDTPDGLRRAVKLGAQEAFLADATLAELPAKCLSLLHFNETQRFLKKQLQDHFQQAAQDPLTGLYNRRYTMSFLDRALERQKTDKKQMGLMILDIDFFKNVNDAFGHSAGDKVLQNLSRLMLKNLREADLVARLGGEEFLIVISSDHKKTVQDIANRLLDKVRKAALLPDGLRADAPVTVSIGVALSRASESAAHLLARADVALYWAKEGGRDRARFCSVAQYKQVLTGGEQRWMGDVTKEDAPLVLPVRDERAVLGGHQLVGEDKLVAVGC